MPGLARAGEMVARILDDVPPGPDVPMLVLEDSAGQGDSVGVTMAELGSILRDRGGPRSRPGTPGRLPGHRPPVGRRLRAGLGGRAGGARGRSSSGQVGLERLAMLHLNDSRAARGSRMDRHEHVGGGSIGAAGMGALLRHPALAGVPAYLETPGMDTGWDAVNMDRVRRLLAGEALPELPPEAYLARGDRV